MKKLILPLFAIVLMAACSEKNEKMLTNEGIIGANAECVSIETSTNTLNVSRNDAGNKLLLKLNLSLSKSPEGIDEIDVEDIDIGSGAKILILDRNGNELVKLDLGNNASDGSAKMQMKKFLQSPQGTTEEFTFSKTLNDEDLLDKVMDEAVSFKLVNFMVNTEAKNGDRTINLSGNIGGYAIAMTLKINKEGKVNGAYYYKKNGPGALLYLKGTKEGSVMEISEYNEDGQYVSWFTGIYSKNKYQGEFSTFALGYDKYKFVLNKDKNMKTIKF